jgi:hypothetical protein
MRRDLEAFPARFARQQIIHSHHVIADFTEQCAVAFGGARRQSILLGATDPAYLIFVAALASRARKVGRQRLWTLGEKVTFFHGSIISAVSRQPLAISLQRAKVKGQGGEG